MADKCNTRATVVALLLVHSLILIWGGCRQSPTFDEAAALPAGISHWQLGTFDLFRGNPPLVRSWASLPVLFLRPKTNWQRFTPAVGARPEFAIGRDFIAANGPATQWYFSVARWTCIPLSVLGGYVCFRWASDLFGRWSAILALTLWCFSPNIIAHGQLITPDMAATTLGLLAAYAFWTWLQSPTMARCGLAGLAIGVSQLAKMSLLVLYGLWPCLWLIYRVYARRSGIRSATSAGFQVFQLGLMFVLSIWVINLGYLFEGSFQPLGDFTFVSRPFTGLPREDSHPQLGNRFASSWLGALPVPLPSNYLLGIDLQKGEFERTKKQSYLRGQLRARGWWYYYLYALLIKVPLGTWGLFFGACGAHFLSRSPSIPNGEWIVLIVAAALLIFVSSHVAYTRHFRYVLPCLPFLFIWISGLAAYGPRSAKRLVAMALTWTVASSLWVYPHSLSYFNEIVGGPRRGHQHLLDSNIDWGQDLVYFREWLKRNEDAKPLRLHFFSPYEPRDMGHDLEDSLRPSHAGQIKLQPGWYAVSVNLLHGYVPPPIARSGPLTTEAQQYFVNRTPDGRVGYSLFVFNVTASQLATNTR